MQEQWFSAGARNGIVHESGGIESWLWERLEPETICCSAGTETKTSWATKDKDTVRTKNNWVHVQLGQILDDKIQQEQKPNCHFGRARSKSWVLRMPFAHSTSKNGWGQTSQAPGQPLETLTTPTLTPCKQGNLLLVLSPCSAAAGAPVKPCLNFLSVLFINFYWLRRPRTLIHISYSIYFFCDLC